jgi:transcriptional regulator with XRE-family HTH domain
MNRRSTPFAEWLNATIQSRGLSQAQLARAVGVADTQVSRWRRGQVVPSVHYLQELADALDVPRATLDRLAGYPVDDEASGGAPAGPDAQTEAELQAYQAQFRQLLEGKIPRRLWRADVEACGALAASLAASFQEALAAAREEQPADAAAGAAQQSEPEKRSVGFRP